eukprot:scaffold3165_cov380-Prasinococcus_capsulatus_cf.AAC.9
MKSHASIPPTSTMEQGRTSSTGILRSCSSVPQLATSRSGRWWRAIASAARLASALLREMNNTRGLLGAHAPVSSGAPWLAVTSRARFAYLFGRGLSSGTSYSSSSYGPHPQLRS